MSAVGRKLRRWRRERGLTERAAARLAGVAHPTYRKIERGDFDNVFINVAARFVRVCDGAVSLEDFVTTA